MEIFQNKKSNYFSNKKIFKEKIKTMPFLINSNNIFYLEDYPILNDQIYDNDASILSNNYFNKNNLTLNEFKLWFQLAQM